MGDDYWNNRYDGEPGYTSYDTGTGQRLYLFIYLYIFFLSFLFFIFFVMYLLFIPSNGGNVH